MLRYILHGTHKLLSRTLFYVAVITTITSLLHGVDQAAGTPELSTAQSEIARSTIALVSGLKRFIKVVGEKHPDNTSIVAVDTYASQLFKPYAQVITKLSNPSLSREEINNLVECFLAETSLAEYCADENSVYRFSSSDTFGNPLYQILWTAIQRTEDTDESKHLRRVMQSELHRAYKALRDAMCARKGQDPAHHLQNIRQHVTIVAEKVLGVCAFIASLEEQKQAKLPLLFSHLIHSEFRHIHCRLSAGCENVQYNTTFYPRIERYVNTLIGVQADSFIALTEGSRQASEVWENSTAIMSAIVQLFKDASSKKPILIESETGSTKERPTSTFQEIHNPQEKLSGISKAAECGLHILSQTIVQLNAPAGYSRESDSENKGAETPNMQTERTTRTEDWLPEQLNTPQQSSRKKKRRGKKKPAVVQVKSKQKNSTEKKFLTDKPSQKVSPQPAPVLGSAPACSYERSPERGSSSNETTSSEHSAHNTENKSEKVTSLEQVAYPLYRTADGQSMVDNLGVIEIDREGIEEAWLEFIDTHYSDILSRALTEE